MPSTFAPAWPLSVFANGALVENASSEYAERWYPKGASGNIVAIQLAAEGHVRIYGINFDVDSDRLRADAKPAIDELLGALKVNPSWHISIERHADAIGNAAHNLGIR